MKLKEKIEKCISEHLNTEDIEHCEKKHETELNHSNLQSLLKKSLLSSSRVSQYMQATDYDICSKAESVNNLKNLNSNLHKLNKKSNNSKTTIITLIVYLLPECCFNESLIGSGNIILDISAQAELSNSSYSAQFELLERWTISMLTNE